ncbi:hypothetical protein AOQ71_06530 [Bradyrhizobium manausense]|uniref:Uncharacterized protein n=1 Tax=Bradyrhizobium manausense TaxID=989370 RepID=A0A0R3E1Y8_9BRAD|nr:hypothetical protein AOQ71_06530 [Bradyrhizobium manausense]
MLASLTISALQNRAAPTHEQVMHHLDIACERAGLIRTHASTIRILERISREISRAESVLDFIGRGEVQPH